MIALGARGGELDWRALLPACLAFLATAFCTWLFARVAERRGWVDDGTDAPMRKLQTRPVAAVGGVAILCGSCLAALAAASLGCAGWLAWVAFPGVGPSGTSLLPERATWILLALFSAFGVGLCDDLTSKGLAPLHKLAGQMVAAACLAIAAAREGGTLHWDSFGLWFAAGVLAQNALNTFDNADGAASSVALLGFSAVAPLVAAALCGFLPFNLWIRSRIGPAPGRASVPRAYLGDAGSHALGILLLLHPQTRLALCLPILDLVRVAFVRMKLGIAPWIGDRRHLAHRMQARGLTPTATVAGLCTIAAPLVLAGLIQPGHARAWVGLASGAAGSLLFFVAALRLCPVRD